MRRTALTLLALGLVALPGCDAATLARAAAAANAGAGTSPQTGASTAPTGGTVGADGKVTTGTTVGADGKVTTGTTVGADGQVVPASTAPTTAGTADAAFLAGFEKDVPNPDAKAEAIKAMTEADVAVAIANYKKLYAASNEKPYEVLKMLLGAYSLTYLNSKLGIGLAAVVVKGGEAPFKTSSGFYWVNELEKPEYAPQTFRSYYTGTVGPKYEVANFESRTIRLNKDGGKTIDTVPVDMATALAQAPTAPKLGDTFNWGVIPGANKLPRKVGMEYTAEGWKVDVDGTITVGI